MDDLFTALEEARQRGDRAAQGNLHLRIGDSWMARGNWPAAQEAYQQAAALLSGEEQPRALCAALLHLGAVEAMTGNPHAAVAHLQDALPLAESLGDRGLQARIYGNLGIAYAAGQDYAHAIEFHHEAMDIAIEIGDKALEVQAQINLADGYYQSGSYTQALGFALVALDAVRAQKMPAAEVMTLEILGMIYARKLNMRKAAEYHQQAADLAARLGDVERQGMALANKALALEALTELETARDAMQEAQALLRQVGSGYLAKTEKDLQRVLAALSSPPAPLPEGDG